MNKKFCSHCGSEVNPEAVICVSCGCSLGKAVTGNAKGNSNISEGMKTAIRVFMILGIISGAFCFLIPLIWCIPMNNKVNKYLDGQESMSTGYKVCVLLFVNTIAGILLLTQSDNN